MVRPQLSPGLAGLRTLEDRLEATGVIGGQLLSVREVESCEAGEAFILALIGEFA